MSDLPVETMDVDPSATSLPNDVPVKSEGTDASAPTDIAAETATNGSIKNEVEPKEEIKDEVVEPKVEVKDEVKKEENGTSTDVKEERKEKKFDPSKPRFYDNGVLKTTAQEEEGKNNSRYDPSVLPISKEHKEIIAQVEFYFSNTNLPKDKHMMDLTGGAENKPVPVSKIMEFGRMKRFQPQSEILPALKESTFLEIIGEEGKEQIIRRVAFDPTKVKTHKAEARSVYAKGFGNEEASSQFDIEAFFAPYGPTNEVRLRRTDNKLFKGSVFVEFENEELSQKFLELDPKPLWKGVHKLEIMSRKAYQEGKEQDIRDGKVPAQGNRNHGNNRGRGGNRGRGDRKGNDRGNRGGDRDPDDWKKRRDDDRASGFKDNRGGRGDRKGGNRGRGGNRGNDRGPRNNDRNREQRADKNREIKSEGKDGEKTEVKTEANDKKRAREDDNTEQAPAKKVDTKSEVTTES